MQINYPDKYFNQKNNNKNIQFPPRSIRAELAGSDSCSAFGITIRSDSPVLGLCRALINADHHPATPLEVYRGGTLCLRVKSIGQAAQLRVATNSTGGPVFKRAEARAIALPMRQTPEAAE